MMNIKLFLSFGSLSLAYSVNPNQSLRRGASIHGNLTLGAVEAKLPAEKGLEKHLSQAGIDKEDSQDPAILPFSSSQRRRELSPRPATPPVPAPAPAKIEREDPQDPDMASLSLQRHRELCTWSYECPGDQLCSWVTGCYSPPAPAPTPPPAADACFSADATVQVFNKGPVPMKDLAVTDQVLTSVNKFEPIYAFGHLDQSATATFLQIHTTPLPDQNRPLEMTPDHLLQANGRFVKASSVKVGDTVVGNHGTPATVVAVRPIVRWDGVYAPLTPSGTLLVDGIVASAYVSLQDSGNEYPRFANGLVVPISQQLGSHMFMAPFRVLCMGTNHDVCHWKTQDGIAFWVHWGIQAAKYADKLPLVVQLVLLVVAVTLVVPIYLVDTLFGAEYALSVFCLAFGLAAFVVGKRRQSARNGSCKKNSKTV